MFEANAYGPSGNSGPFGPVPLQTPPHSCRVQCTRHPPRTAAPAHRHDRRYRNYRYQPLTWMPSHQAPSPQVCGTTAGLCGRLGGSTSPRCSRATPNGSVKMFSSNASVIMEQDANHSPKMSPIQCPSVPCGGYTCNATIQSQACPLKPMDNCASSANHPILDITLTA